MTQDNPTPDHMDTPTTPTQSPSPMPIAPKQRQPTWLRWTVLSLLAVMLGGLGYHLYQKQPNQLLNKNSKTDTKTDDKASKDEASNKKGKGGTVAVTVVASQQQNIALSQILPALVVPLQQVIVRPTQTGQIVGIYFKDGQYVKKGQLLAKLDDRLIQTSIANAKAVLQQNEVQLATNLQSQQRYQSLLKDNAVSQQEVDQLLGQTKLIQAQQATNQTQLQSALVQLANTEIRAPFAGVVGVHKVSVGSMVSASDTNGIVTLTQVNPIGVSFGIPNGLLAGRAINGIPIEVWTMADNAQRLASSTISSTDGQIDNNGNLPVQAIVNNSNQQLTAGQPVKVKLITKQYSNVVTVPLSAVKDGLNGQYIMTVQPNKENGDKKSQIATRQDIQVIDQNDDVAIIKDLPVGVLVIIDGNSKVRDGASVSPVMADAQQQGGGAKHQHSPNAKLEETAANQPTQPASQTRAN